MFGFQECLDKNVTLLDTKLTKIYHDQEMQYWPH
jgi:hypothetical protein